MVVHTLFRLSSSSVEVIAVLFSVDIINHLFAGLYGLALCAVVLLAARRTILSKTEYRRKAFSQMLVFYGIYMFYLLIPYVLWQWWIDARGGLSTIVLVLFSALMIYSRFIEPNRLVSHLTQIRLDHPAHPTKPIRLALIADLHVGLFSGGRRQLEQIVDAINLAKPDLVVVAGDWTYEAGEHLLQKLAPLAAIKAPVYSVPGNHDEELPGPPVQRELREALICLGIQPIEGQTIEFEQFRLIGTGDLWAGKVDLADLANAPQDKPWVVVAHNPDTVDYLPIHLPFRPLMLSGHTHGGQIQIPRLTQWALKKGSVHGYQMGLYEHPRAQVFVTAGTGMVAAPFRCGIPPCVDLLELV
jgi:predicted MPP superfamily phosphohydrolase